MDKRNTDAPAVRHDEPEHLRTAVDETEWVDWDHWQSVEELQKFMDDLSCLPDGEAADAGDPGGRIARQIRRHGLETAE